MRQFLILSLGFLLVSCSTSQNSTSPISPSKDAPSQVGTKVETQDSDYTDTLKDVSEKLKNTPEFNSCIKSNISVCVQSSAMQIAQKDKSPEFCEELTSTDQKDSCKFAVIMVDVRTSGDITKCDSLSQKFKNNCIFQGYKMKALAAKDVSLCDKIPQPDVASGSKIGPMMNDRSQCALSVIISNPKSTVSDCDQFEDASMKKMCLNSLQQERRNPSIRQEGPTPLNKIR